MYNPAEEKTETGLELALPEARAKYIPLHLFPDFFLKFHRYFSC
jgi:hypothetical protein